MPRPFRVGHPAYSGANACARHPGHAQALRDLLSRGVPMAAAQRALKSASQGSFATCRTRRDDVVEVVASHPNWL